MAFALKKTGGSIRYPVELTELTDAGTPRKHRIEISFRRLNRTTGIRIIDEHLRTLRQLAEDDNSAGILDADADFILEIADDWHGVTDDSGEALTFNRDNVLALLDYCMTASNSIRDAFTTGILNAGAKKGN